MWGDSDCQSTENNLHSILLLARAPMIHSIKHLLRLAIALLMLLTILPSVSTANQSEVATCKSPSGWAYYHSGGLVPKDLEGWRRDQIDQGSFRLKKLRNGEFDIEVLDAMKTPFSLRDDGGDVMLLRASPRDATFLHFVKGKVIEIYTFWLTADGKARFDLIQSKGGATSPIHKSAVMVGECTSVRFELLN